MSSLGEYETHTLNAYRTRERAAQYKRYHTTDWSWARFTTSREQRALLRELSRYSWTAEDRLLDIPCGTGILGPTLKSLPFRIVASDISPEMMEIARGEYRKAQLIDCVEADITRTGLPRDSFACVVTLGFMHRVPAEIKRAAFAEIAALSSRLVIVTCSVDAPLQRFKRAVVKFFWRRHIPAPCPATLSEVIADGEAHGLKLVKAFMVVPFLSSEAMLVFRKG